MLKAMKKKMKDQRGLTLVELLAVIVILGIIASIAVPSIGKIIENSKEDAAYGDALQIINAAKLAHAANPNNSSWDETTLADYLSKSDDKDFQVNYNSTTNKYSITGHEKAATALKKTTPATDTVTEDELVTAAQ